MGAVPAVASGTRSSRRCASGLRRGVAPAAVLARWRRFRWVMRVRAPEVPRLATGIGELDRVLGGGIVPGSVILIGGAGHRQVDAHLRCSAPGAVGAGTLYVSGEESTAQVALRAQRLRRLRAGSAGPAWPRPTSTPSSRCWSARTPDVCVIDSVQTLDCARALPRRSRLRGPGARGRRRRIVGVAKRRRSPVIPSVTSRRTGRSPGRACSSTSWTACCDGGRARRSYRTVRADQEPLRQHQ